MGARVIHYSFIPRLLLTTAVLAVTLLIPSADSAGRQSPPLIEKQPPTDIQLFQVAQRVDENDKPFIIECEASGSPEPKYRWIKNGKEFNWQAYDDRISQQPGRGTLVVTIPRDEDIGQYQCFATNEFGTATSNSVFLRKAELNSFSDDQDVQTLVAEEGKPFKLPCNAPDGWPPPRVDWMLQSKQGAIKSINSSRLTVDPEGTLWFSNVTRADRSTDLTYACSAYSPFRHEYKLGNRVYLSVSPTSSSTASNKFQPTSQYMTKRSTVATRGEKLELWCIIGGTPLPEIQWTKRGGRLPYDRVEFDNYQKTLRLLNVDEGDAGSYECSASNGVGSPISYSVDVRVDATPYFTREPELINAADEETVELVCEAKGRPAPIIKWIHNGKPIEEAPFNPRRSIVDGNKIIIRNLVKTDTGNYGCNATNSLGYVYKDVYVNVLTLPAEIIEEPKDTVWIEGQTSRLICRVFGAPKPLVRWIRNEQELTGGRYKVLDNGDLEIRAVSFSDSGAYTCLASNKFGNDSRSASLVVKAPTVIHSGPENYQVAAGNPVTFRCTAGSDSSLQLIIEWYNEGGLIDYEAEPRYVKLQDNSLTIDKTTELDSGTYTCFAKTAYDNASAEASLIVQDVPNRPELVAINCRSRDATLRWKAMGDNRSPILHYTIQFNTSFTPDSWEVASKDVPATESSYTVSMSPWANYTFRVIARNSIGPSLPSLHSEVCFTPPDVPFKNPENVKGDKTTPYTLLISWTPMPEIEHNAAKFQYEVQWKPDEENAPWTTEIIKDWRTSSLLIPNQPIYRPYLIKIRSFNEKGQSNVAPTVVRGFSGQDTPTTAPSNLTLLYKISSRSAMVAWSPVPPETLNGKFEGYKLETWTEADGDDVFRTMMTQNSVTQAVIELLIPYSRNFVRVSAYNTDHTGPSSRVLEIITDEGTPGPVENVQVRAIGTSALYLIWEKPEHPNGNLIGYRIKYVRVDGTQLMESEMRQRVPDIAHPDITSAKLAGLQPNTVYRIFVAALTRVGPGTDFIVEERTFAETGDASTRPSKPSFLWDHAESENGLSAVRINWRPTLDVDSKPGSHFFTQYKEEGRTSWTSSEPVLSEDFEIVRGLEPGLTYLFRVVSVDGTQTTASDEQEVYTYSTDGPTIEAKEAGLRTTGWFIGLIVTLAFLLLLLILICIIKRNRGGKYAVYEREIAYRGRLDFDSEPGGLGGFPEYSRPTSSELKGAPSLQPSGGGPTAGMNLLESDTDSMVEYGDEGKFTEDGSFIGQYGVNKRKSIPSTGPPQPPQIPSPTSTATFV